jgi:hypothetical protein
MTKNRQLRKNRLFDGQREIFLQGKVEDRRNTLCISRASKRSIAGKDPLGRQEDVLRRCQKKKGAGRTFFAPHGLPFCTRLILLGTEPQLHSGGQNLAALCTAAGENLTTVGSSHSLAETVNLGAVTAAGLVGTLHLVHLLKINHAQQPVFPAAAIHCKCP